MTKTYTDKSGKFATGNPGKPKGARHKTTQAALTLLDGEAEALTRQAVELALAGDTTALRLCLERIVPTRKDAPIVFDMPNVQTAADASNVARAILAAVASGDITPLEGTAAMGLIESFRRILETTEIEERLTALETA